MFQRKQLEPEVSQAVLVEEPVDLSPTPKEVAAVLSEIERNDYEALAGKLGFRPAALIKDQLLAYLESTKVKVFSYEEVRVYLNSILGEKPKRDSWEHTWGWRPLRESDVSKGDLGEKQYSLDNGEFAFETTYHAAVPLEVLQLAQDIEAAVPGVSFFVSDVLRARDRTEDPFLAVTCFGMEEMIVVACWDEPSFFSGEETQ